MKCIDIQLINQEYGYIFKFYIMLESDMKLLTLYDFNNPGKYQYAEYHPCESTDYCTE